MPSSAKTEKRAAPKKDYRAAQVAARQAEGAVQEVAAREITASLRKWANQLASGVANLPGGELGAKETITLLRRAAQQLEQRLLKTVGEQRVLSFEQVQQVWTNAVEKVASIKGLPTAMLGAVRVPPLSLLGAYQTVGGANHWKTLIPRYVNKAAEEANGIVRGALLQGVSPDQLARRLRPYVSGAESFYEAFGDLRTEGIDLKMMKAVDAEAARALRYNTMRIAVSETHNARAEAEVQHFMADPYVKAVAWRLAPDRGSVGEEGDECDVLAKEDFYGLGPGVYPVNRVPITPHPFDRCERVPITQDRPAVKPNPPMQKDAKDAKMPKGVTKQEGERIRERLNRVLTLSNNDVMKQASSKLDVASKGLAVQLPTESADLKDGDLMDISAVQLAMSNRGQFLKSTEFTAVSDPMQYVRAKVGANLMLEAVKDMELVGVDIAEIRWTLKKPLGQGSENWGTFARNQGGTGKPFLGTINLNTMQKAFTSIAQTEAGQAFQFNTGWWTAGHQRSLVHHEIGHAVHWKAFKEASDIPHYFKGGLWETLSGSFNWSPLEMGAREFLGEFYGEKGRLIAHRVSRYAATNPLEFVAETFSGLVAGRTYDDEIMKMYKQFKGVMPKTSLKGLTKNLVSEQKVASLFNPIVVTVPETIPILPTEKFSPWAKEIPLYSPARDVIKVGLIKKIPPEEIIKEMIARKPASKISMKTVRSVIRDLKKSGVLSAAEEITLAANMEKALKTTELIGDAVVAKKVRVMMRKLFKKPAVSDKEILHILKLQFGSAVSKMTEADIAFKRAAYLGKTAVADVKKYIQNEPVVLKPTIKKLSMAKRRAAENMLREHFKDAYVKMTEAEKSAVRGYQSSSFSLNSQMRQGKKIEEEIRNFESAFRHAPPLERDLQVFRGANWNWIGTENQKALDNMIGTTFVDKGFTSTSTKARTAGKFGSVLFEIRVPRGTRGIWMPSMSPGSSFNSEREFVLQRKTKFRVIDVIRESNTWGEGTRTKRVVLEVVS